MTKGHFLQSHCLECPGDAHDSLDVGEGDVLVGDGLSPAER